MVSYTNQKNFTVLSFVCIGLPVLLQVVWLNVVTRKTCMYFFVAFISLYPMTKFQFIVDVAWIWTGPKIISTINRNFIIKSTVW